MSVLVSSIDELIVRKCARVAHRCRTCRATIDAGDPYLEYCGETSPYQSGYRYCLPCGLAEWGEYVQVKL